MGMGNGYGFVSTFKPVGARENSLVWYKKKKEGKNTLSKSERRTVLLLASFIPG